jgi:hypothetical protein
VPIQHGWATDLVDVGLAEEQLLPRDWGLGLRRDLVYYRSPRNAGSVGASARLVWYVSGKAQGAGTIRAVSHLTGVVVDTPERLFQRFRALGVYRVEDVEAVANPKSGDAMALRFSSTIKLRHPVPLAKYREIVTGDPESKSVTLRSIHRISEHTFVEILKYGAPGET